MAELRLNTDKAQGQTLALSTDILVTHDTSEEFSLPDYVPEIRRLLGVKTGVLPESRYISDNGTGSDLEFGGTITYLLIYTDDEGKLCSLPLTSNYETKESIMSRPVNVFIDTVVDSISHRVTAPRKITLKARLKSRVWGWENWEYEEKIDNKSSADELFLQRKTETVKMASILPISMQDIRISDKLDAADYTNPRPIWCDASMGITDVKAQNNTVSVRGEIIIKCVCLDEGKAVMLKKSMPLAEELDAPGAVLGDMARVNGRCVSLSVSNRQNENGEELLFDFACELEGELIRNCDEDITKDCYSTKYETVESYKTMDGYSVEKAQSTSFTINESLKRKNREISTIIDVLSDPVFEKAEFKGGKCIMSGSINLLLIGEAEAKDEGEKEYLSESYEIPFKFAQDVSNIGKEPTCRCIVSLSNDSARYEGDKLLYSAEVYPSFEIIDKTQMEILDSATIKKDKEIKKDAACVRVYFPREGDTLWEIAKKYHTTIEALKETNELSREDVQEIKNLIV